mgnify:CR=1 FL=1
MNSLLKKGCYIDSETVVFNKKAAKDIGLFNEKYKYILDYDFFIKMGEKYNLYCNKSILSKWRIHDQQATNKMYAINLKEHLDLYYNKIIDRDIKINIRLILLLKYIKVFFKQKKLRAI